MSEVPQGYRFKSSHEWARQEANGTVTVGISDHAQGALGDLVYVELPQVGRVVAAGEACAVVESVKAASDVYAPIGGTVCAVNEALADRPETINAAPYADGWLFALTPTVAEELTGLLSADDYAAQLAADA